jgi:hypothetical protein
MSDAKEEQTLVDTLDRKTMFIAMLDNDVETLERDIMIIKANAFDRICEGRDLELAQKLAYEEINSLCANFFIEVKENLKKYSGI